MACNGQPTSTREGYHAFRNDESGAVVPNQFIRSESGTIELNKTTNYSQSKQNDRAVNIQAVPGQEEISGSVEYSYDSNESPFALYGALGGITSVDVSSATDSSVFEHTIAPDLCLPSFSYEESVGRITDTTNDLQNYLTKRTHGAVVNSIDLKIDGDRVMLDTELVGKGQIVLSSLTGNAAAGSGVVVPVQNVEGFVVGETVNFYDETPQSETTTIDAIDTSARTITVDLVNSYDLDNCPKVELVTQTPSYSVIQELFATGNALVRFGTDLTAAASADAGCIRGFSLKVNNDVEQTACLGSFSAAAGGVVPKGRTVEAEFTRNFLNKGDMDKYIQAKSFAMIIEIDNNHVVSATDTNNQTHRLEIRLPKVNINSIPMGSDNNGINEYTASVTAVPDATAGYDIQFKAYNAKAGTYYTA